MRAPKETKAEAKARRERIWKEAEQRARDLEGVWERTIQSLLDRQMESVLARLEGKRGRQMLRAAAPDASNVFDAAYWEQETADTVRSLYEQVTMVAGTAQATALGGTFKMTDAWVRDFIGKRVQKLSPQVTSTTYDAIKRQLADGAAAGEGIPELATRIRGLFQQTYKSRAQTVARTEVISAYNGTAQSFAMQSELVGGLEWIATMDARTRLSHAEMDGHVIHKGGAFVVDGHTLTYPGDPDAAGPNPAAQIINCRCTVAPVLREDMPAGMKEPQQVLDVQPEPEPEAQRELDAPLTERRYIQPGSLDDPETVDKLGTEYRVYRHKMPSGTAAEVWAEKGTPALEDSVERVLELLARLDSKHPAFDRFNGELIPDMPDRWMKYKVSLQKTIPFHEDAAAVCSMTASDPEIVMKWRTLESVPDPDKSMLDYVRSRFAPHRAEMMEADPFGDMQAVFNHEYGHFLHNSIKRGATRLNMEGVLTPADFEELNAKLDAQLDVIMSSGLSRYGATNRLEAFAEAFAEWYSTNGTSDVQAVRDFAQLLGL